MRPNFAYTAKEVQEDVRRVFACGFFAKLTPVAEDTRDGVKLTMEVHVQTRSSKMLGNPPAPLLPYS